VKELGADYMANFSPVSRAEISARLPEQIRRLPLREESFSPFDWVEISSAVSQTGLEISARSNGLKNLM